MKIAYLRVSTKDQSFESQKQGILNAHSNIDEWVEEKTSGVNSKPELELLIYKRLRPGDELIVYSLSRLSRNNRESQRFFQYFQDNKIIFHSVQEKLDLTTANGPLVLHIYSALVAHERETLLERQLLGIQAAKEKGLYLGRVWTKLDNPEYFETCYQRYLNQKSYKYKNFMEATGLKETTLFKFMKLRKELGEPFPNRKDITLKIVQDLIQKKQNK
jgi:DNA invertase Pin-like site-specific DNA recombinase